ncbi:MAG: hypothetical protein WAK93_03235, partial [Solirubrobacteraceae bacterium]
PAAVFGFAGAAGGGAVLIALLGRRRLVPPPSPEGGVELRLESHPGGPAQPSEGEAEDGSPADPHLTLV